jgi:hypothetical protein
MAAFATTSTWTYVGIVGTILITMTLLSLLSEYKFVLMENFVGGSDPASWMPTASGRHPEGEPKESEEELQGSEVDSETSYNLLTSERLVPMTAEEKVENWSRMTSERCFRYDMAEPLRKVRNFLQRTNNYSRSHPDSCSAPNHEMVGTFYRPHEGVGARPDTGDKMPVGALRAHCNTVGIHG